MALIENMQRSDLNFFEEAAAIYALMQDRSMTQEETARRLGMSQPSLANKIRLLRLSGEEQRMVLENHLTERHARALLRMEDPEKRMAALKTVIAVSYTHLDVYKRQAQSPPPCSGWGWGWSR